MSIFVNIFIPDHNYYVLYNISSIHETIKGWNSSFKKNTGILDNTCFKINLDTIYQTYIGNIFISHYRKDNQISTIEEMKEDRNFNFLKPFPLLKVFFLIYWHCLNIEVFACMYICGSYVELVSMEVRRNCYILVTARCKTWWRCWKLIPSPLQK